MDSIPVGHAKHICMEISDRRALKLVKHRNKMKE
jgi:hypothetical protein